MNDIFNTPLRKSFRRVLADEKQFIARQEKIAEEQNRVGFFDAAQAALEKENSLYWFLGGLNKHLMNLPKVYQRKVGII